MKPGEVVEFFLAGAGAMPGLLMWLDEPGLAMIVLVALLLAACLGGMADPEAPFRTMARPPAEGDPGPNQSGMRQEVPQTRQRTRSQG
jgi:hypothetical protein